MTSFSRYGAALLLASLSASAAAQAIYETSFEQAGDLSGTTFNAGSLAGVGGWSVNGTASVTNAPSPAATGTQFVTQGENSRVSRTITPVTPSNLVLMRGFYRGNGETTLTAPSAAENYAAVIGFKNLTGTTLTVGAYNGTTQSYAENGAVVLNTADWNKIVVLLDYGAPTKIYHVAINNLPAFLSIPFHKQTVTQLNGFESQSGTGSSVDTVGFFATDGDYDNDGVTDLVEIQTEGADPFNIYLPNANVAPTSLALSSDTINENQGLGSVVGDLLPTDANQGEEFFFALVPGTGDTDNASFAIVGGQLRSNAIFNFETKNSYSVRVQVTDIGGESFTTALTINVGNLNDSPTNIAFAAGDNSIPENSAIGTAVGNLQAVDPDAGDSATFTLIDSGTFPDNAAFTISGSELRAAASFNFEAKNSYQIRVRAADSGSSNLDKTLTVAVSDVNEAPSAPLLSNSSINEQNGVPATIGTISATDPDSGDVLSFSLGGADASSFSISGNQLRAAASFDFETKSSYSITIRSTDTGALFAEAPITITVNDANDPPSQLNLSGQTIAENVAIGTAVGTLTMTDPDASDPGTFSLIDGEGSDDNAAFTIVGNQLRTAVALDFETQSSYAIRIQAVDNGGLSVEQSFVVTVTDVDESPRVIFLTTAIIAENQPIDTVIGILSGTAPGEVTFDSFALATEGDIRNNDLFQIFEGQLLTAAGFDFEATPSLVVVVDATASDSEVTRQELTISVTNVNEAPAQPNLSATSVLENSALPATVGTIGAVDPDAGDTVTFSLTGLDAASFAIVGNQLRATTALDRETKSAYFITIVATDAGTLTSARDFTITVNDANDPPSQLNLSGQTIAENVAIGTAVGTLTMTDPDASDPGTFSLIDGEGSDDNAAFSIVGNQLRTAVALDFETQSSYAIRIQAVDNGGLSVEQSFLVTVTDVDESPRVISLTTATIAENQPVDTVIGVLSGTAPGEVTFDSFALATEGDIRNNDLFQIFEGQLLTAAGFDFEATPSLVVVVDATASDSEVTRQELTISVTNVNEAPAQPNLSATSVLENSALPATVGTIGAVDPDAGDTVTFSLTGLDAASFAIVGNQLRATTALDRETKSAYFITIVATDAGTLTSARDFTIAVGNVNEQPTAISLSNNGLLVGTLAGNAVGSFSTTDPDADDTFTYELVAGAGSTNNSLFAIEENQLVTNANFNDPATLSIRVRSMDAGGLTTESTFTINVTIRGNVWRFH